MIDWIPVDDSTRIVAMAYNPDVETIYVRFPDGVEWYYAECAPWVWEEFSVAPSKGRYIHDVLDHKPNGHLAS